MKRRNRILIPVMLAASAATAAAVAFGRRSRLRAERHEQPADTGFMLAMHGAFRRDLNRLVARADTPTQHTIDGFHLLARQLEHHHDAEDEDLWPLLRTHVDSPAITAMEHEHAEVPPMCAAVEDAIARGEPFGAEARALRQLVLDHLDHEERDVLPLVEQHLDDAEWHGWLMTERAKRPPPERVEFLTWVLDDAEPPNADAVLRELPPLGRVVYRRVLEPRYRKRHLWAA
jgi:hemerythrin-like domain-containing protein